MSILRHSHKHIAQPALEPRLLVHQLVGVDDADGACEDAKAIGHAQFLPCGQVIAVGDVGECREKGDPLQRRPDQGDQTVPKKIAVGDIGVGV